MKRKTLLIKLHVDVGAKSKLALELHRAMDHFVEGLRVDGAGSFYEADEEKRPDEFKEGAA